MDDGSAVTAIESAFVELPERCDLVIPVSDFGRVSSITVTLNGAELVGAIWRRGPTNDIWFPVGHAEYRATDPENSTPAIFAFRVLNVATAIGRANRLVVKVQSAVVRNEVTYDFALPYVCCPRAPQSVRFSAKMSSSIRAVWSPNRLNRIQPIIRGKKAEVGMEIDATVGARVEDYLFIFKVELGDPIKPECADPVALLIMVSAVASLVLFSLTHSLEPEY